MVVVVFVLSLSFLLKVIKLSATLVNNKAAAFRDGVKEEFSESQRDLRIILAVVLVQVSTLCEVIIDYF